MLRDLILLLCRYGDEPRECLERLLAWAAAEPSRADLDLDLRLGEATGALDAQLRSRLLAAMTDLERETSGAAAVQATPDLAALAAEVASLETRHVAAAARRAEARRLESAIQASEAALAELAQRIEQTRTELAAAETRCRQRQTNPEERIDEPARSIAV